MPTTFSSIIIKSNNWKPPKMTWFCSTMPGVQYSTIQWVLLGLSMIWINCHQCQHISCPKTHCQLTGIESTQYTSQKLFLFNHYSFEAVVIVLSNRQHLAKTSAVFSGGARAPLEFGGSGKRQSLISAYQTLAFTTNTPGFKKLNTALLRGIIFG